jgi:hypothetical protein
MFEEKQLVATELSLRVCLETTKMFASPGQNVSNEREVMIALSVLCIQTASAVRNGMKVVVTFWSFPFNLLYM